MDDFIDAVLEFFTPEPGGPIERNVKRLARIAYDTAHQFLAKGSGPIVLGVRALDAILERAGVPADNLFREQFRREIADIDRYGGYGMRVLEVEEPADGPSLIGYIIDPGPYPDPRNTTTLGVVDP